MTQLAPPGPLVSTGRLRVDAARAVTKLREYQLADRPSWVLEAVRAAVASGARAIDVTGDANDVRVRWEGEPWPDDALPQLLDALVSPEPAHDGQHLRLLATAVNSALGLAPAYVDVIAIGAGRAVVARYRPDVLVEGDALRAIAIEPTAPPPGPPGMLVHLRRRASLETLGYLFGEPPELSRVREACRDVRVPVQVGDVPVASRDRLRVALGEGLEGWVAVVDTLDALAYAELHVAERGVVLARYPVGLGAPESLVATPVPVRVFVDAARMPTNASRSDVRMDVHPIASAVAQVPRRIGEVVAALAAAIGDPPDPRLRDAALALLGGAAAGPDWAEVLQTSLGPLEPLATAPIVRNAVGQWRAPRSGWNPRVIHVGDEPFAEDLAPWLGDVLWAPPGDPSRWLVAAAASAPGGLRRLVRSARRTVRAQQRFLEHAARDARLAPIDGEVARATIDAGWIDGEVAVRDGDPGGRVTVLYAGRELQRYNLDAPVGFEAVISTIEVTPTDGYRGVARDARLARVEGELQLALLRALETLARRDPAHPLVRRAFVLAPLAATSPLQAVACWPTLDGEHRSLAELRAHAVVGTTSPSARMVAPAGRVIVRAEADERAALHEQLPCVVYYDPARAPTAIDRARELAERIAVRSDMVALAIDEGAVRGAIAWGAGEPRLRLYHQAQFLNMTPYTSWLAPCELAVDADAIVPDDGWLNARDDAGIATRDYHAWEQALACAVARELCGELVPELVARGRPLRIHVGGGAVLAQVLGSHPAIGALLGEPLLARLAAVPMFPTLGGRMRSAADYAAAFETSIPVLEALPEIEVDTGDWQPAIVSGPIAAALFRLANRRGHDARVELEARRAAAVRARRLGGLRERPREPRRLPDPTVEISEPGIVGVVGVGVNAQIEIGVRVEERSFQRIQTDVDLPLVAILDVNEEMIGGAFEGVEAPLRKRLFKMVRGAASALLLEIVRVAPASLADDERVQRLVTAWMASCQHLPSDEQGRVRTALREAPAFPTLQGGRDSVWQATEASCVRVASWVGTWLVGDPSDPPDLLDGAILFCADGDAGEARRALVAALAVGRNSIDVTADVRRLQAERRIARGVAAAPRVQGADPTWARRIGDLQPVVRELGPGEIALVDELDSRVIVHAGGEPVRELIVDVAPPIRLAVEGPELAADLDRLTGATQDAATSLLRATLAAADPGELPAWLVRSLRRGLLAGRVAPDDVGELPLFETTAGAWVTWRALAAQQQTYGDVWVATRATRATPLDDGRLAIRLRADERTELLRFVDATHELELDELARASRARPPVAGLALTPSERAAALAIVELRGDGVSAARGIVAVLGHGGEGYRGIRVHRALQPLGTGPDPCTWPTVAVIDDARLAPDRTWSAPQDDAVWAALQLDLRRASESALQSLLPVPPAALASRLLTSTQMGVPPERVREGVCLRGALWIDGPPGDDAIDVMLDRGAHRRIVSRAPVRGAIVALLPLALDPQAVIGAVAEQSYRGLVELAATRHGATEDVLAHLAHARAILAMTDDDLRALGATGGIALALANAPRPAPLPRPTLPGPPPEHPPPRPPPPHPLAAAIARRLATLGVAGDFLDAVVIDPAASPPIRYAAGVLHVSQRHAGIEADPVALDALVAHAVTVLNVELTVVTDTTEAIAIARLLDDALASAS